MSENILIGKNRKTGKWELLCDPSANYDEHNRIYRQFSTNLPVSDTHSKILFGRVQNTNTPLTLITSAEKSERDKAMAEVQSNASNAGKDAEQRQAKLKSDADALELRRREQILDEKNAMVNKIRIATGQQAHDTTAAEILENETQKKLAAIEPKPIITDEERAKALAADAVKSKDELLSEKNKLVEQLKSQSEDLAKQRSQANASVPDEAGKSATPATKK